MDYTKKPFYLSASDLEWVDNAFACMTLDDKLNQVFVDMLWNASPWQAMRTQASYQLGGFRYSNGSPQKTYHRNAAVQKASRIPSLIAANVEAGGDGAVAGGTKLGEGIACGATADPKNAYYPYCHDIGQQAEERYEVLMQGYQRCWGIDEALKSCDPME